MASAKPLQAGDLDRKLDVYKVDTHRGTKGELGQSDSPYLTGIPCQKIDKGGTEAEETGRETAYGQAQFTIRYRNDLKESMSIYFEGIKYDILNIREGEGRRQWTVIDAKKHN